MNRAQVVDIAKHYVSDVYRSEKINDVSLEEIRRDGNNWEITVSFRRPEDKPYAAILAISAKYSYGRTFKCVTIDDLTGEVTQMTNRTL